MRELLDIRIGTMIRANAPDPAAYVRAIVKHGFESIEPFFWQTMNKDLPRLAGELREAIGDADVTIDTLGMFGNPLENDELDRQTLAGWEALIDNAHLFGARTVAGFTGRVRGQPLEASLSAFKRVWGELAQRADDKGVRLAFENCAMDGNWATGDWNIAHNPDAWELMFDALPNDNLGLEWEPCHQLVYLIDPLPQIRKWAPKILSRPRQGRDGALGRGARARRVRQMPFVQMRTPGFGDTDWTRVISELRLAGYSGPIDIEGWHDPVYRDELGDDRSGPRARLSQALPGRRARHRRIRAERGPGDRNAGGGTVRRRSGARSRDNREDGHDAKLECNISRGDGAGC